MSTTIRDPAKGQPKTWFELALDQQKTVYDATLKAWSQLFAVPRVLDQARDVQVGTTAKEVV